MKFHIDGGEDRVIQSTRYFIKSHQYSVFIFIMMSLVFIGNTLAESDERLVSPCSLSVGEQERFSISQYIEIGGTNQWVTLNGTSCTNPIVLMIHGGPGNPLSLYHEGLFQSWERDFTIVHRDQRGSGKTYEENHGEREITIQEMSEMVLRESLMIEDGIEVTNYIRKRFGQDKIIITGSSWGAFLAAKMVLRSPEQYHFYVGLSLPVNYQKNLLKSYQLVTDMAITSHDAIAIKTLNEIGRPPWTNPRNFGRMRKIIRQYENKSAGEFPDMKIGEEYRSQSSRTAYLSGEEFSFIQFVGMDGYGMANKINLDVCCVDFSVPIYLIQGANDLLTSAQVTEEYYTKIKAPFKEYIYLENTGHDLNIAMLNSQFQALRAGVESVLKESARFK